MGIIQNIPRKNGRINNYPPGAPGSRVFGNVGAPGDLVTTTDAIPDATVASSARSVVSSTGGYAANPVGGMQNTATQRYVKQLSSVGQVSLRPQYDVPEVGLHEHGSFFSPQIQKTKTVRQQGGVAPDTNTPFHPSKTPVTRPRRYPATAGERTNADSFSSDQTLMGKPENDLTGSRWAVIKRDAAHAPASDGTDQPSGIPVGSGTTGTASTATLATANTPVSSNAHQGSPNVAPWIPQIRRGQPNERGNTFPIKQPCQRGGLKGCGC